MFVALPSRKGKKRSPISQHRVPGGSPLQSMLNLEPAPSECIHAIESLVAIQSHRASKQNPL